jgi:Flp pilus assembly protein TadG
VAVETAVVLPVFFLFIFGLLEFAHAFMVANTLTAACKRAAREGVAEGVTTSTVSQRVRDILGSAVDTSQLAIYVKDAAIFDTPNVDPTSINYSQLPNIELTQAAPRHLFVVYAEIPYNSVSLLSPHWITGVMLKGHSVMRHE